ALHDVTPVARGIPDRQEDQLVFLLGLLERLGAPGVPVGGVVGVHQEVGALLLGEAVGVLGFVLVLWRTGTNHGNQSRQDSESHGSTLSQSQKRFATEDTEGTEKKQ